MFRQHDIVFKVNSSMLLFAVFSCSNWTGHFRKSHGQPLAWCMTASHHFGERASKSNNEHIAVPQYKYYAAESRGPIFPFVLKFHYAKTIKAKHKMASALPHLTLFDSLAIFRRARWNERGANRSL